MIDFRTEDDHVVHAVTSEQMRDIDRIAIEDTGPNLFQMMENAGRNLATLTVELLGEKWRETTIAVLAGTGGNGGGGICAARHLANHGSHVVLIVSDEASCAGVLEVQLAIYRNTAGVIAEDTDSLKPGIVLDAMIGYGLRSAPRRRIADLIRWANRSGAPILALDVPSGIDATSGDAPGNAIAATWTMTLALPKTGLIAPHAGQLFLADIGIPEETYRRAGLESQSPFGGRYVIALHRRRS